MRGVTPHVIVEADNWDRLAALSTIVAFLGIFVALYYSWKTLRQERQTATASARRAEAATRVSEGYTERIVEALESIARAGLINAESPRAGNWADVAAAIARPPKVSWRLQRAGGDSYQLTNVGDRRAYQVEITSDPTLELVNVPAPRDVGEGEALVFLAAPDFGTNDMTVTVTWTDETGDKPLQWRYPLPA